ncbi:C39 family peptidase [Aquimarina sediminis]|uniref:C39 family peptidase n=1 Tax=Aquimarina sediminis TaxID=2070536 RepID=UPI000CA0087A|nr:C39 family peptidase [Aquimarina sediminis]
MSKEFYALKNLKLFKQPDASNLCWVACIRMLYYTLKNGEQEVKESRVIKDYKESVCFNTFHTGDIPEDSKILIKEKCISPFFKNYGLTCDDNSTSIYSFQFYVDHLKNNKAPLLLGLKSSDNHKTGHLVIAVGYGQCDNQNYLLIFDPDFGNQSFLKFNENEFRYSGLTLVRLWSIKFTIPTQVRLEKYDFEDALNYELEKTNQKEYLSNYKIPIIELDTPKELANLDKKSPKSNYIPTVYSDNTLSFGYVQSISKFDSNCIPTYSYPRRNMRIIDKTISELSANKGRTITTEKLIFIHSALIEALITTEDDKTKVFPFLYPKKYGITENWYDIEDFSKIVKEVPRQGTFLLNNSH